MAVCSCYLVAVLIEIDTVGILIFVIEDPMDAVIEKSAIAELIEGRSFDNAVISTVPIWNVCATRFLSPSPQQGCTQEPAMADGCNCKRSKCLKL